jgi:hypothetical protein
VRLAWLVVPLVVAAVLAWWLFGRDAVRKEAEHEAAGLREGAGAAAPPALEGVRRDQPTASPRGTGTVVVRVTRDGKPVDADVSLTLHVAASATASPHEEGSARIERLFESGPPSPFAWRRTREGTCELAAVPWGACVVAARTSGGLEGTAIVDVGASPARAEVTLELVRADLVLDGRVGWSDGRSVTGRVVLKSLVGHWGPLELDAEGRFRVDGLAPGLFSAFLRTAEGVVAEDWLFVSTSRRYELTLDALAADAKGRVVSAVDGAPVAGAVLVCVCHHGDEVLRSYTRATSLGDGAFSLPVAWLPASVEVTAPGFVAFGARLTKPAGTVIRLAPEGVIRGRVVSAADGSPVDGAVVMCSGDGQERTGRSGPDGKFTIEGVPSDRVVVYVRGGGWVSPFQSYAEDGSPGDVTRGDFEPGRPLDLELGAVPSHALEGRVLDETGAAVAGATIRASTGWPVFGEAADTPAVDDLGRATSASDGAFRLADLPPGIRVLLDVRTAGGDHDQSGPHLVGGPFVEARLRDSRWVYVHVVYADDGQPVIGAHATLEMRTPHSHRTHHGSSAGADGVSRVGPLRAESGPASIRLSGAGLLVGQPPTPVDIAGRGDVHVAVRALRGAELRGHVLLPDGSAARGAHVACTKGSGVAAQGSDALRIDTRAARDGSFRLRGLPQGDVDLVATMEEDGRPYRATARVPTGRGTGVVLRLEDNMADFVTLRVEVVDPGGGSVPQADVILDLGERGSERRVSQDGVATWRAAHSDGLAAALLAGELRVHVRRARDEHDRPLPLGPARVGPLAADQRVLEVRLPAERVIEGRVLDDRGAPVPGVRLAAQSARDADWEDAEAEVRSDANGRFRLGGLGSVPYQLHVDAPSAFIPLETREVVPGAAPLMIALTKGASARVRVLDADGAPVAGAHVSAGLHVDWDSDDPEALALAEARAESAARSGKTAADGTVVLEGMDRASRWHLRVEPPHEALADLLGTTVATWSPADTEVRLPRARSLRGTVRDPRGAPIGGAMVHWSTDGGSWTGQPTAADGSFRVGGLPAGATVWLHATPSPGIRPDLRAQPLAMGRAGDHDLVLVLDAGASLVVQVDPRSDRESWRDLRVLRASSGRDAAWELAYEGPPEREGGRLTFRGLDPGTPYALWLHVPSEGRFAWAQGVRVGGPPVPLTLERGATISGALRLPSGSQWREVTAEQAGLRVEGLLRSDDTFAIPGLPPGPWRVRAKAFVGGDWIHATGQVEAGSTLDLTLQAR